MQFSSKILLLAAFISTALAAPTLQDTVGQIENDLNNIKAAVTTLNTDISKFSGGSSAASGIQSDATKVSNLAKSALTDVQNTPPLSESDANTIISLVKTFVPLLGQALNDLVAKKPNFDKLGDSSIVAYTVNDLGSNLIALADALRAKAPADIQSQATALENQIKVAFATAEKAY